MAKTCPKCGATLPRHALKCPKCGENVASGDGAALFTSINAETESWKIAKEDSELKKKAIKYVKHNKTNVLMTVLGIVLAAFMLFFILFNLPMNRMKRMLSSGRYEEAYTLYQNKQGENAMNDAKVENLLAETCSLVFDRLNSGKITLQDASDALASLEAYGLRSDAFDDQISRLIALIGSKNSMSQGRTYYDAMDWENAGACFEKVIEADSDYEEARSLMNESYDSYGKAAAVTGREMCDAGNAEEAVPYLKEVVALLEGKEVYCADLYDALDTSCLSLADSLIAQAETLSGDGSYEEAQALLARYEELTGENSDAITEEMAKVQADCDTNLVKTATASANEKYEQGDVAGAFAAMDNMLAQATDNNSEDAQAAYEALEKTYTEDITKQFENTLDGNVENLKDALAIVTDAIAVHETQGLSDLDAKYEEYLPVSLTEALYTDRTGTVLRSADGWMWGTDGSTITFATSGEYEYMEGSFGLQKTAAKKASGYFEVYSDDKLIYTSEKLGAGADTVSFHIDISEVNFLVIKFHCNYEVSTASGGTCYHAIFSPQIVKQLP